MLAVYYGPIATMAVISVVFTLVALALAYLLRPVDRYDAKLLTYECGLVPWGEAWSKFFVRYYVIALIFVLFDVEAIFLAPWAVVYRQLSHGPLGPNLLPAAEMGIFLGILLLGLIWAWRKGDLEWA
ncbi:MAG TPA: NADH-quinone oxidoreductase subunit A [Armatimonadota bacterium]|jgi:NADH-quinone oxidoreductase subunit A